MEATSVRYIPCFVFTVIYINSCVLCEYLWYLCVKRIRHFHILGVPIWQTTLAQFLRCISQFPVRISIEWNFSVVVGSTFATFLIQ